MTSSRSVFVRVAGPLTVAALLLAACSASETDFADAAKKAVEGDLGKTLGLGELSASCEAPATTDVGTDFSCVAQLEDGREVLVTAVIAAGNKVEVNTTNVVDTGSFDKLYEAAAKVLTDEVGVEVDMDAFDCGTENVVLDEDDVMVCTFTAPDTGDEYDAAFTFTDLSTGDFTIEIGSEPRS